MASGSDERIRASATRCCCPPEICAGCFFSSPSRRNMRIFSASSSFFCALCSRRMPQRIFCSTVMFGKSAYCWKRYPTRRCWGGRSIFFSLSKRTRSPSTMRPRSGVMMPAMHFKVTLLPQPEAPSSAVVPSCASNCARSRNAPSFFSMSTQRLIGRPSSSCPPRSEGRAARAY